VGEDAAIVRVEGNAMRVQKLSDTH
jgi:hypothetical protein